MKKIICLISIMLLACSVAKADFAQHYNAAQTYLTQYQYSSAIAEFKKALRINYMDESARIGLVNSYLSRGTYFANNDKDFESAANDYRAALFYLKYFPVNQQDVQNSAQAIANASQNLNQCLNFLKFSTTPTNRFEKARDLRLQGLFPESGYEFMQCLSDSSLQKEAYEQLGDIMRILTNDQKVAQYYQKAVALNPENSRVRLKYARALDKLDKCDEAVKEYNFALAEGGDDPEILYALERIYRQKLAQMPDDAPTLTSLGAILQKQNKFDEALQYYTKAGQIDGSNVTTRMNIGTLYQQKKTYDAAIAAYDSILTLHPNDKQVNFYKAQCLAASGQKDNAIIQYKRAISLDAANQQAKNELYDLLRDTMTPRDFMAYMLQNASANQNAVSDMYSYAIELHKQNKLNDAISCYNEVLKLKSDNPEVYVNLAIAYKQNNNIAQAKQILEGAKLKFPTNKQILDNLQTINSEAVAGKFDDAAKAYTSGNYKDAITYYMAIQPPTFDSLSGIAACYKGLDNDAQAIEYYKKALNLKADSDIAYYIGVLYSEKEDWTNSKIYLKKALAINPNNTKVKDIYQSVIEQANVKVVNDGIALYDKANYSAALKLFNQVIAEDPKNAYALYYRGLIYDVDKKYALAIADYKKAVVASPDLSIIHYLLALDYEGLGQFKNALMSYKKYVSLTAENNEYKTYSLSRIKDLKKYEQ